MRTRIKFCGLTRAADVSAAVELGVDAVGFVMVPASPRWIAPAAASKLRRSLPPFVTAVALLKDADPAFVQEVIDTLKPDLLQFHGSEDAGYCESFGVPYIKAVSMDGKVSLTALAKRYASAQGLLLDSHAPSGMGGTGKTFDWGRITRSPKPLVLAGGLNPDNVAKAVKQVQPYTVDVSSGIERKPGIKDASKMRAFVDAVKRADSRKK
jgi:phosphoribosylanthranilate isomerase